MSCKAQPRVFLVAGENFSVDGLPAEGGHTEQLVKPSMEMFFLMDILVQFFE